jgi:hypothetical protein
MSPKNDKRVSTESTENSGIMPGSNRDSIVSFPPGSAEERKPATLRSIHAKIHTIENQVNSLLENTPHNNATKNKALEANAEIARLLSDMKYFRKPKPTKGTQFKPIEEKPENKLLKQNKMGEADTGNTKKRRRINKDHAIPVQFESSVVFSSPSSPANQKDAPTQRATTLEEEMLTEQKERYKLRTDETPAEQQSRIRREMLLRYDNMPDTQSTTEADTSTEGKKKSKVMREFAEITELYTDKHNEPIDKNTIPKRHEFFLKMIQAHRSSNRFLKESKELFPNGDSISAGAKRVHSNNHKRFAQYFKDQLMLSNEEFAQHLGNQPAQSNPPEEKLEDTENKLDNKDETDRSDGIKSPMSLEHILI